MMDNEALRDFIAVQMGQLTAEINRLSVSVDRQSTTIRDIDIKTTTRIAELQKDVEEIRRDVMETRQEIERMNDSQKFRWKSHDDAAAADKKDRDSKDRIQAIKNNQMETVNKVLWAIFAITLSLFVGFVWQLLLNGGLKGMGGP